MTAGLRSVTYCYLLWDRPQPIVVTGAMRHPGLPRADGPANLSASFQVVSSLSARDLGVLVVLNDEIHAARFVHKSNIAAPDTFGSPGFGPLGYLVESTPRFRLLAQSEPRSFVGPGYSSRCVVENGFGRRRPCPLQAPNPGV